MKKHIALIVLAVGLLACGFTACTSSQVSTAAQNVAANVFTPANTKIGTTLAVTLILQKNPKLIAPLREIDAGVDQALTTGNITISNKVISDYVQPAAKKYGLQPTETILIVTAIEGIASNAAAALKVPSLQSADPRLAPYIQAFHEGVAQALALLPAPTA